MPVTSVYLIRVLAILLIVNSHMAHFYPTPRLAFGGHLGNSIFYLISGYGLALSFNKNPMTAGDWIKKRFTKLLIPLVLILGMINIGSLQAFKESLLDQLVWHKSEQLEYFIPVLLGLYLAFLPIGRLSAKGRHILIALLIIFTGTLFYLRLAVPVPVRPNLPSEGIFYAVNGLICFVIGVSLAHGGITDYLQRWPFAAAVLFAAALSAQVLHMMVIKYAMGHIYLNFYLNIICVTALFLLFPTFKSEWFTPWASSGISALASSSLAVYLVHFEAMRILEGYEIAFPYNAVIVFLNSFLWAYGATRLTGAVSDRALSRLGI